jgi:hypothetical protein
MIGKVARMMAGRSLARKFGYSAGAGAVAGLLAPFVIRKALSLVGKAGKAAVKSRQGAVEPEYGQRLGSTGIGPDRS